MEAHRLVANGAPDVHQHHDPQQLNWRPDPKRRGWRVSSVIPFAAAYTFAGTRNQHRSETPSGRTS
jgi:hypothetical protein